MDDGALTSPEADEIEEERDVWEESEIIDSGDDTVEVDVEMELARDDRRVVKQAWGGVKVDVGHFSSA